MGIARLFTQKRSWPLAALIIGIGFGTTTQAAPKGEDLSVPIAPITPVEYEGWTNAFFLRNATTEIVVIPAVGRIVHLALKGGTNLLNLSTAYRGKSLDETMPGDWMNVGGDWLWPMAQSRWTDFNGTDWPPSPVLDAQAWTGRAWRTADEGQQALLTRHFGEPLNVRVTRTIHLSATGSVVRIHQLMERTAPSDLPMTLWQISQIRAPDWIVMPVDEQSAFPGGLQSLRPEAPDATLLTMHDDLAIYDARKEGEYKLGSDSSRAWIAVIKGTTAIIEQAFGGPADGTYPDGGCTVEFYAHLGLGYAEIETLSVEDVLAMGDLLDNTVQISLHTLPSTPTTPSEAADLIQTVIRENNRKPAAITPD